MVRVQRQNYEGIRRRKNRKSGRLYFILPAKTKRKREKIKEINLKIVEIELLKFIDSIKLINYIKIK